jgi:predicted nucleotidyltransferase
LTASFSLAYLFGNMLTEAQRKCILEILRPFDPQYIGVFGSYARGQARADSDLDLLVRFGKPLSLLDLVGAEQDLSEALGIKVDLVTDAALHPMLRPYIESDVKRIA